MSANYSKLIKKLQRLVAVFLVVSMLSTLVPAAVLAEETLPPEEPTVETPPTPAEEPATTTEETATSTGDTTTPDGETASSTDGGTDGGDGNNQDGEDGEGGAENATSTTATSTPPASTNGTEGAPGTAGASPDDEVTPVEIVSDPLLGDVDSPEEEETTGDLHTTGTHALIETGIATAQGELSTNANSNDVRSEFGLVSPSDYDTYMFTATGTNSAIVSNDGLARSTSGDNYARGRSTASIYTGNAVAAFNVANVINTNVVNSDGFIYLANKILDPGQSLDLTSALFPDPQTERTLSEACSLRSCVSEDVVYNMSQLNHATITNDILVEAVTGENTALADLSAEVTTGDAYAAANVINVVNTNIIDSNYRLFTYNAIGDLDGDLVLPTGELVEAFFGRANAIAADENSRQGKYERFNVHANNQNDIQVDNNVEATAETGNNESTTDFPSSITTGRAESESNTLNKINENTYGGDSMYMLIRVHGEWSGEVVGLPENLTWEWTPQGIIIYNVDAEIAPSAFLSEYDLDSYTANLANTNDVTLENNIKINAITGENEIDALVGNVETGNAFASANLMNIANTNIIGTNWAFAVINILGDFDGNVSFAATDLTLTGAASSSRNPVGPNDTLTYSYSITNQSDTTATNVILSQTLQGARTTTNQTAQNIVAGTLAPGASKSVTLTAKVNPDIAFGTSSVVAYASVTSDQGDVNTSDNLLMLSRVAFNPASTTSTGTTTATTTPDTTATSTNATSTATTTATTTATSTPPVDSEVTTPTNTTQNTTSGGGGGPSSKKTNIDREAAKKVDPNKPPVLTIKKVAVNVKKNATVKAGTSVDYKITLSNNGGNAYDVEVFDVLTNPIGSVVNEQSWVLGTVLPGEVINLTYTTEYNPSTPSGTYTNTASVEAYLKAGMKVANEAPLKIKNAVYTVRVKGIDLAVGNVATLAYFPGANGKKSALVTWETSRPAQSQVFYGPTQVVSPYNRTAANLGYAQASFRFPTAKPRHMMILTDLLPGRTYTYRMLAESGSSVAVSNEYTFTLPSSITTLTLANPPVPTTMVAGAATSTTATTR